MRPLLNRRVLVTRARGQSSALAQLLAEHGAIPILLPTIEIAPPSSWCALDAALTTLRSFDWVVFTSANAVHALVQRARSLRISLSPRRVAVVGPATAQAVTASGLATAVDLMPTQFVAEALAAALAPHCAGANMLLVRAASARDLLPEALTASGANVTIAEAYRNQIPQGSLTALQALLAPDVDAKLDAITFTSASTARNLFALLESAGCELPATIALASIGPITSAEMRSMGFEPAVEAEESTIAGLVETLTRHFRSQSDSV